MRISINSTKPSKNQLRRKGRRLWQDEHAGSTALGCTGCVDLPICGGLNIESKLWNCLDLCCGGKDQCQSVCPNAPTKYVRASWEINSFVLDTIPKLASTTPVELPPIISMIYHGRARHEILESEFVAIPLGRLFSRHSGLPKYVDREALERDLKISSKAKIVVNGVDLDPIIEGWWGLQQQGRRRMAAYLASLQTVAVTSPNFSLFTNRPRHDNFHAMKRIATAWSELAEAGLKAALHVNGRADMDFVRWSDFIQNQPSINTLAYEFVTGSGSRKKKHVEWLERLTNSVGRPLDLIYRGSPELYSELTRFFRRVTLIETNSFMKAHKRKAFFRDGNYGFQWVDCPTDAEQPLDHLLDNNIIEYTDWFRNTFVTHRVR